MPGVACPEECPKRFAAELSDKYAGIFGAETVERYVLESYAALLRTSTVRARLANNTIHFDTSWASK